MPLLPVIQTLEARIVLDALAPSAEETYLLELINRARANPTLEAARYGIDLNEGLNTGAISTDAKQPLAVNAFLVRAAEDHANYLLNNGLVSLVGAGGTLPADRITTAGYAFTGTAQGSAESDTSIVPATTVQPPTQAELDQIERNLFVDNGIDSRVDRTNLLASGFREVGPAFRSGSFMDNDTNPDGIVSTIDYALSTQNSVGDLFITGVAYNDANSNSFYDIGEGLGGVTVTARRLSDNATFTTTTFGAITNFPDSAGDASGAYSLRVPAGTYDVIATGGGLTGDVRYPAVVVGSKNVKRDFTDQQASGTIPPPDNGPPPGIPNPVTIKGDLIGKLYVDKNGDGKRAKKVDDQIFAGVKIYVDTNKNNVRDSTEPYGVVLKNGTWNITGLAPSLYQVDVDAPTGYRVSVPGTVFRTTTVSSGDRTHVKQFLITPRTLIAGTVYRDDNADGAFTSGEKGLKNWRIFIDLNNDGVWQRGTEPSTKSDSQGKYSFRDLVAGTYTIRIIPQVGYLQTEPANNGFYVSQLPTNGISVINSDFGERLLG